VAEIVLREGAGPDGDVGENGFAGDGKQRRDFAVDEGCEFLRGQFCSVGIGGAADEACEESMTLRGAAMEEGGIPDGAENAETGGTGNEETEALEPVADVASAIAERDHGDCCVGDGSQQ
jgi:hypothetical protein